MSYEIPALEIDPRRIFLLPKGYLSYSQVVTYLKCPRQYYETYCKGIKTPDSFAAIEGSLIHTQVEGYYRDNFIPPVEDLFWETARKQGLTPSKALFDAVRARNGLFWKEYPKFAKYRVVASEKTIGRAEESSTLDEFKILGVPFTMRLDLLAAESDAPGEYNGDATMVLDLKVTSYAKSAGDAKDSLQLSLYSIGSGLDDTRFISFDKKKADIRLTNAESKVKVLTMADAVQTEQTRRHAAEVVYWVADQITKGNFPLRSPESDGHWNPCSKRFCPVWDACRGRE